MTKRAIILMMLFLAAGVSAARAEEGGAILWTTGGKSYKRVGWVRLSDTPQGLSVRAVVNGLPPGKHGFHIHEYGYCGEAGMKAGDHYNPDGLPHGLASRDGVSKVHAGDLGNIEVGPDGTGRLNSVIPGLSLAGGKYTVGGRSVVLHEKEDTFGQPAGNAGARIVCGVVLIVPVPEEKAA
jgi:Cu-Zn family superoxide dismutase